MGKGYKAFDKDLKCGAGKHYEMQYKVGNTYTHIEEIELCVSGFHFCVSAVDVFNYYEFNSSNRICIIEYDNKNVIHGDDKSVTGKISIINELSWHEVLELVNSGNRNSGNRNSGNRNSGNRNSGDGNSGNRNSGDGNIGNRNSGDGNSGNRNSGDGNIGNRNSGDGNSGDWNSCDFSAGIFCSIEQNINIFNTETDITQIEFLNSKKYRNVRAVLYNYEFPITYWLYFEDMSNEEKEQYKKYKLQGGVLLRREYKTACELWWKSIPEYLKEEFVNWEYFDAGVFEEITGINVKEKQQWNTKK